MEKYFVFSLASHSDCDFEPIYQKVLSSVGSAFSQFYSLVGQYSSDFSKCSVESFDTDCSLYLKKTLVVCGDVRIFVYLQKLS